MLISLTALAVFLLDRLTKSWAQEVLMGGGRMRIFSWLTFDYLENRGAAFGILQGKIWFFALLTLVISFLLIRYYRAEKDRVSQSKRRLLAWACGLVLGGGLGNLVDRVGQGYVVDFIVVHFIGRRQFPTFNVADIGVTIGTLLLIIYVLMTSSDDSDDSDNSDGEDEETQAGEEEIQA